MSAHQVRAHQYLIPECRKGQGGGLFTAETKDPTESTTRATLLVLQPVGAALEHLLEPLRKDAAWDVVDLPSPDEIVFQAQKREGCLIVFSVREHAGIALAVALLKRLRPLLQTGKVKALPISPFLQEDFPKIFNENGCPEVIPESTPQKTFRFKLERYVKMLELKTQESKSADPELHVSPENIDTTGSIQIASEAANQGFADAHITKAAARYSDFISDAQRETIQSKWNQLVQTPSAEPAPFRELEGALQPLAMAIWVSEWVGDPEMDFKRISDLFCKGLAELVPAMESELWLNRSAGWECIGASSGEGNKWGSECANLSAQTPVIRAGSRFTVAVRSREGKILGALVLNIGNTSRPNDESLQCIAQLSAGFLESQAA